MFEEVILFENGAVSEDEFEGAPVGKRIRLKALLDWMEKVNAGGNAKFLKCLNWSRSAGVSINSIVDVVFSANLVHKLGNYPHGVKIAFKEEGPDSDAMTIGKATELFAAIAAKCEEEGIDTNEVEVFTEDPKGKLTQFSWYYDSDSDTACIAKNMNTKMVSRFLKGAEVVVAKAATTPKTTDRVLDELQKIQDQMAKLKDREAAALKNLEDIPA